MSESCAGDGWEGGESVLQIKRSACSIRATWEIRGSALNTMWPNWKRKSLDWWRALSRKILNPIKNLRTSGHTNPTTAGFKPWLRATVCNTIVAVARSVIFFIKWGLKWWLRKACSEKGFQALNLFTDVGRKSNQWCVR